MYVIFGASSHFPSGADFSNIFSATNSGENSEENFPLYVKV
jgi:hypothetical protein